MKRWNNWEFLSVGKGEKLMSLCVKLGLEEMNSKFEFQVFTKGFL